MLCCAALLMSSHSAIRDPLMWLCWQGSTGMPRLHVGSAARTVALRLAGVLASGGEDRRICIWDLSRAEGAGDGGAKRTSPLMFMHLGHRGGVRALGAPHTQVQIQHRGTCSQN